MRHGLGSVATGRGGMATGQPMWRIIKKAKELWDWISLVWQVVGLIGQTAFVSTLVVTIVVTVAAILKHLPWPLVVAVAWVMVVGMANVVVLFATRASLRELRTEQNAPAPKTRPIAPPNYEAWRNVERFAVRDAACLWVGIEPRSQASTPDVDAWIRALCAAISKGELEFEPSRSSETNERQRERRIRLEQSRAGSMTIVRRDQLAAFAKAKGYHPKFLE
jgi:hypothetical protein